MGPETLETIILEIGCSILALGMALITGWLFGALLARRQYGAVFPFGLILAAVALLLWWEPLVRIGASFSLLLIGYTWLFAWLRASQQESDQVPSHQSRFARGGSRSSHNMVGVFVGGMGRDHHASRTRKVLEMRQTEESVRMAGGAPSSQGDARRARMWEGSPVVPRSRSRQDGDVLLTFQTELPQVKENQDDRYNERIYWAEQPRPHGTP